MSQQGNDHYVPQFILRRFLPKGKGRRKERLFYAEKATPGISRRGAARTFCEVGGDLLLRGPPTIRQEGTYAVLIDEPEYTTGIRQHLSELERRWAPAIKRLVETVYRQHRLHTRPSDIVRIGRVPPKPRPVVRVRQGTTVSVKGIVRRTSGTSCGRECWRTKSGAYAPGFGTTLGKDLDPNNELRAVWRDHNRHKIRTGAEAEAEGLFEDVDSAFVLTTWFVTDDSRFIVGSKGGVLVQTDSAELWICPVDPRVALGIEGRRVSAQSLGIPSNGRHHFAKGYLLPRDDLTVEDINRASWIQCRAVAGMRRQDVAGIVEIPVD